MERIGDIVIGDFWGVENFDSELYTENGVSLVIPITTKGRTIIEHLFNYMELKEVPIQYAIDGNPVLYRPAQYNPQRDRFFEVYKEHNVYEALNMFVNRPSLFRRIASKLPESVKVILRKYKH